MDFSPTFILSAILALAVPLALILGYCNRKQGIAKFASLTARTEPKSLNTWLMVMIGAGIFSDPLVRPWKA